MPRLAGFGRHILVRKPQYTAVRSQMELIEEPEVARITPPRRADLLRTERDRHGKHHEHRPRRMALCGGTFALTGNGKVRAHGSTDQPRRCIGSGWAPATRRACPGN